jgi:hypothetical protein
VELLLVESDFAAIGTPHLLLLLLLALLLALLPPVLLLRGAEISQPCGRLRCSARYCQRGIGRLSCCCYRWSVRRLRFMQSCRSGSRSAARVCAARQRILRRGDRIVCITLATACADRLVGILMQIWCPLSEAACWHACMHRMPGAGVHACSAWQMAPLALERWRFSPAAVLRNPQTQ